VGTTTRIPTRANDKLKADAQKAIEAEWMRLPSEERKTEHQAFMFAMRIKDEYRFKSSPERYQVIMGWLRPLVGRG
jgi:hypothetical protein